MIRAIITSNGERVLFARNPTSLLRLAFMATPAFIFTPSQYAGCFSFLFFLAQTVNEFKGGRALGENPPGGIIIILFTLSRTGHAYSIRWRIIIYPQSSTFTSAAWEALFGKKGFAIQTKAVPILCAKRGFGTQKGGTGWVRKKRTSSASFKRIAGNRVAKGFLWDSNGNHRVSVCENIMRFWTFCPVTCNAQVSCAVYGDHSSGLVLWFSLQSISTCPSLLSVDSEIVQ